MDPLLYKPLFLHLVVLISLIQASKRTSDKLLIPTKSQNGIEIFILSSILILWLGLRPISGIAFGDTSNYAISYKGFTTQSNINFKSDVLFYSIMYLFAQKGINVHFWFLIVELIYIGGTAFSIYKLFPNRTITAFAVVLTAFSFFTYSVNGIRNGMACSIFLIALPFVKDKKWIWAIIFCIIAINIHMSLIIPVIALILSRFFRNTKVYITCWLLCIMLAIVAGGYFENLFISQGLIDTGRTSEYLSNDNVDMSNFSHSGFRYDFLLYSCIPIIIGSWFIFKLKFNDKWYRQLLNIYIICNSIWVLVNENWLSNRIAYLSWFMYGFVLMYPILMNPYVKNRKTWIMLTVMGNALFTYIMWIIGKYM